MGGRGNLKVENNPLPKFKIKRASVIPARRKLVKTMIFESIIHSVASLLPLNHTHTSDSTNSTTSSPAGSHGATGRLGNARRFFIGKKTKIVPAN